MKIKSIVILLFCNLSFSQTENLNKEFREFSTYSAIAFEVNPNIQSLFFNILEPKDRVEIKKDYYFKKISEISTNKQTRDIVFKAFMKISSCDAKYLEYYLKQICKEHSTTIKLTNYILKNYKNTCEDKIETKTKVAENTENKEEAPFLSSNDISEPKYPNGEEAKNKFISENFVIPKDADENSQNRNCIITATIEKDGTISNLKKRSNIGFGVEEELIRVIKLMPKFEPAKQNGKYIKSTINFKINIRN